MKTKSSSDVNDSIIKIINKFHPNEIEVDMGSEFTLKSFKYLLNKYNIKIRYVDVGEKIKWSN